ncbi:MAG: hypothetical protein QOJ64_2236 [Acidobacteriota bacterium]|jgi:hypothetical protein|nr:hypothetical protein [Acidobacteriota bacterium]
MKRSLIVLSLILLAWMPSAACTAKTGNSDSRGASPSPAYSWVNVTDTAAFPGAYNFPVFTMGNQMWAFHHQGNWFSADGRTWTRSELPLSGLNSGYQKFVQLNGAVYALGTMEGDYTNLRMGSRIVRTTDFKSWEVMAESSQLPARIFYGAVVFNNEIMLFGGFDGKNYYNDVWESSDAVHWKRVAEKTAWSPRIIGAALVFKNRIWVIGGGVIDGTPTDGRAGTEVWSSADGINWTLSTNRMARLWGTSPIVFDGRLWLVGANRDGTFSRALLVTDGGVSWEEESAPWSPRGAVSTWVVDNKLYMTGGKYSDEENGETRFIYRNDVWCMARDQKSPKSKVQSPVRSTLNVQRSMLGIQD